MEFTSKEVFSVVSEIHKIILRNTGLLKERGVFRESGSRHHIETQIAEILEPEKDHSIITAMGVHDYIGALKHVLLNRKDKFSNTVFKNFIQNLLSNQTKSIDTLFTDLVNSKQKDNLLLAESLYKYIQIIRLAAGFQEVNGMDAKNLGLMLGPVLTVSETMEDVAFLNDFSRDVIKSTLIATDQKFIEYIAENHPSILPILLNSKKLALEKGTQELGITNNVIRSCTEIITSQNDFIKNRRMQLKAVEKSIEHQQAKLDDSATKKPVKQALATSLCEERKHAIELVQHIKIKIADKKMTQHVKQNALRTQSIQIQNVNDLRNELNLVKKRNKKTADIEDWSVDFEKGSSPRLKRIVQIYNQSKSLKETDEGPVFFKRHQNMRHRHEEKREMPKLS